MSKPVLSEVKAGAGAPAMLYSIYTLEYIYSFVQECANLDEETYEYIRSAHPAIAHFLDASREIVEAVEVAYE